MLQIFYFFNVLYSQEGLAGDNDMFDVRPTSQEHVAPLHGRPEKEDLVFDSLHLDEEMLYNATWKSEHGTHSQADKPAAAPAGVIQGAPTADDNEEEECEEQAIAFLRSYHDTWIAPVGARATHMAGGRYYLNSADAEPTEEEPAVDPQPAPTALPSEEVVLWSQDWEEASDEGELLTAHDRLQVYADVFEDGKYMEVGSELRKNPKVFATEKKEVLARVILAAREHLEHKPVSTEPTDETPSPAAASSPSRSDAGIDRSVVTIADPCRDVMSLCCCNVFVAIDNQLRIAHLDAQDTRNEWKLPAKYKDGMFIGLKDVNVELTPIKWRWRLQSCCCFSVGPCVCRDSGSTTLRMGGDVDADLEISVHPAPVAGKSPVTFRESKLSLSKVAVATSNTRSCCECPTAYSEGSWEKGACCAPCRDKCCSTWYCSLPSCFYSCLPVCCSCCIQCYVEKQFADLPKHFPRPPPPQRMV